MVALYGASFTRQWQNVDPETMKRTWARELGGFSRDELVRGLNGCRTREYPPTLPEFRNLCRPNVDYEAAFAEAARLWPARAGWSHPAIYWAALSIGNDVKLYPYERIRGRWREALARALGRGDPLPEERAPARLEYTPPTAEEREEAYRRTRSLWDNIIGRGKKP